MEPPSSLYIDCPDCKEETLHHILSGRITDKKQVVLQATAECQECKRVHKVQKRETKPIDVPIIVSHFESSEKKTIDLEPDDMVLVGDELLLDDGIILIMAIDSEGKRVGEAKAENIDMLWAKTFDQVRIKISINKGEMTIAKERWALPDDEFTVGELLTFGRTSAAITSIKTHRKKVRTGTVSARDIVRIYCRKFRQEGTYGGKKARNRF